MDTSKQKYVEHMLTGTKKILSILDDDVNQRNVEVELQLVYENFKKYKELSSEKEEKEWYGLRLLENRYNRSKRLLDLGAPRIIKQNELEWLLTMVHYLSNALHGIEPLMPKEREDELNEQIKWEREWID